MSDNNISTDSHKDAKENADLIGVDPLAWLSDEEKASMQAGNEKDVIEQGDGKTEVKLQASLTIRDIKELLEQLNGIDNNTGEIVFDVSQVERVDAAAIQLLVSYYLSVTGEGKAVVWKEDNEVFIDALKLLGLDETLKLAA